MDQVNAANAMVRVLRDWGVRTIYGLPGGSFDSTMNALHDFRDELTLVGVRQEEIGALAAVAEVKLTGQIGVCFGSAGPGAVHLLNGLYDARTDGTPVLALVGQVPNEMMNMDYFQEFDQGPIFADVAVYCRTVMTAEQLPMVVDTAIRRAYAQGGVAVVIIPKDLGWAEIADTFEASAGAYYPPQVSYEIRAQDVERALDLIQAAERPIVYFGQGALNAADELRELSDLLNLPLLSSYLAKTILDDAEPNYLVSTGRVATKPAADVGKAADLLLFVGTNYEFGSSMFADDAAFIDVNTNPDDIASRHTIALGIQADAKAFLQRLIEEARNRPEAGEKHAAWLAAARATKDQWTQWIASKTQDERTPIRLETLFHEINRVASADAVFGIDVGNVNIAHARFLRMKPGHSFVTSPLYATMGFGIPAGIAAGLRYPDRQVWTISGDGAASMVAAGLLTQAEHRLPVINVVLSNDSLGFIEGEQEDSGQPRSGVALSSVDFATLARSLSVRGITVTTRDELIAAMDAVRETSEPVLIDVEVTNDRMLPVEQFPLRDGEETPIGDLDAFREHYEAHDLEPFATIAARHGVEF